MFARNIIFYRNTFDKGLIEKLKQSVKHKKINNFEILV